ncbi:MAG: electron transport complex subunit RsxC [Clostridia bacterium]|nr:electron transport complex subunit RsxC [Clostridia bacterium]MBR5767667.1 electron transport complex subunit RsxC [Clostridia bacterium]
MLKSFLGGVHPRAKKELASGSPIRSLYPGGDFIFLTNQHIGAPAVPCVKVGDRVLVGQTLCEAGGFVSADILSSVSGTVKEIGPHICQNGESATAVVVTSDGEFEKVPGWGEKRDWESMTTEETVAAVRKAGIVGMGGAGFPTAVKLTPKDPSKIDYVICNGSECEPYITCDHRLMLEKPERAVLGMRIVMRMFPGSKGVFGIENNKKDGIASVRAAAAQYGDISVVALREKYPQGGERVIIHSLTGRKVNSGMLPADAGCLVFNFSTLCAIADAVCDGIPLVRRVVTVSGEAINEPSNFDAPIGMSAEDIIAAAGGYKAEPSKIIFGGPMMGAAVYRLDIPVTKTTSCILAISEDETTQYSPMECIRCGKCLTTCPERLMPIKLKNAADEGEYGEFEKLHGMECIGCGCCTYICPAKRRISQSIAIAKRQIIIERKAGRKK